MDDYEQRFSGLARLVGTGGLARLRDAHVCVVGVGGVGSWAVEALARSGIGALTLIDLDDVCVTNVNRQLPALDGNIGRPKVEALAERVRAINPGCRVDPRQEFFTATTASRMLDVPYDFVVDAIDRMSTKALLIGEAHARGRRVLTVGGAGGRRDPTQIRTGDLGDASGDELLRQVRRRLRRDHGFAAGTQKGRMNWGVHCVWSSEPQVFPRADGSCAAEPEPGADLAMNCDSGFGTGVFVTGAFGLVAAAEIVRVLTSPPAG